jgi:hypothetical protein
MRPRRKFGQSDEGWLGVGGRGKEPTTSPRFGCGVSSSTLAIGAVAGYSIKTWKRQASFLEKRVARMTNGSRDLIQSSLKGASVVYCLICLHEKSLMLPIELPLFKVKLKLPVILLIPTGESLTCGLLRAMTCPLMSPFPLNSTCSPA